MFCMNTTASKHHITPTEDPDDWRQQAACSKEDPSIFFPDIEADAIPDYTQAKTICGICQVSRECLETAMENEEIYGVWGGKTPAERHLLKSFRRASSENFDFVASI